MGYGKKNSNGDTVFGPLTFAFNSDILYSMINKVLNYVKKYQMIEPEDTIVAGVSGGADSVCLLFVLMEIQRKIPFTILVVHINHKIRQDAAADADFVRGLCEKWDLPFFLVEEDVKRQAEAWGISEEEAGRQIRYQAFFKALGNKKGKVAVAHNSNDRAETMLFHLFRGTGLAGAGGIRPVSGKIIRPLLCIGRNEIEGWLEKRDISFCTDSTNLQDVYTRNRIRHHILAYAEGQVCQGAAANMNRAADQLLEAEEYICRQTQDAMERCVQINRDGISIKLPELFQEDAYLRGRILLNCVGQAAGSRKNITAAHIKNMENLFKGTGSREIHLPYGLLVYKKYDVGMIQKREKDNRVDGMEGRKSEYEVFIPSVMEIPTLGRVEFTIFSQKESQIIPQKTYTKWFDYDKITSSIVFRTRKQGDYFTINKSKGHKSLQDYFVNEKVPKKDRDKIFLLAEGSHVIWIPGYRISEHYKISGETRNILQVKIMDKEG